MSSRTGTLLASVPKTSRILEIGPSFNPIAPKSQGWNSASLDHMSREGLVKKYRGYPDIDVTRIETVDFVWTDGLISDAVPAEQHGSFDVFLASHVIEHTPDFVGFLDAAATLLKPDGVVILAIPDKRYCFDYFQQITTTGQVLDAHLTHRSRHGGVRAFDHFAYSVTNGGEQTWPQRPSNGIRMLHKLEDAHQLWHVFETAPQYQDLHAWHFVPPSFELILLELARIGETDWQPERVTPTMGWEFFAWLRRGAQARIGTMSDEALNARRVTLLKRSLLETQAQIDWLLAGEPELIAEHAAVSGWATPAQSGAMASVLEDARIDNAALRHRLAVVEAEAMAARQRVAALEASTSWRVTEVIRMLSDRMRQMRTTLTRQRH
jgi:SAM-dependent methyltransferase